MFNKFVYQPFLLKSYQSFLGLHPQPRPPPATREKKYNQDNYLTSQGSSLSYQEFKYLNDPM